MSLIQFIDNLVDVEHENRQLREAGERLARSIRSLDSYAAASFPCPLGHSQEADAALKAWDALLSACDEPSSSS